MAEEAAWEDHRPDRVVGCQSSAINPCQHSKTHTRTESEAGPGTLGVDEKAASWKELQEVADWAYQSVAVHLCGLGLAQESDVLVVDCGCGPVWRDAWNVYLRARAWLCTCPGQRSSGSGDAPGSAW